jgi:transposase InsO family protein
MSEKGLKALVDRMSLPSLKFLNLNFFKYCVFGKQCRQKFKTGRHISKGKLDYIHSYVWAPSPIISFGVSSYFVTFIDDYSRKVWVYLLKIKADVFNTFKQFKAFVEKRTDESIKFLRIDNGGEFTSVEFGNYCKEAGIERHKTTVYTPSQNGFVKCMNRTLIERTGSMLSNANL